MHEVNRKGVEDFVGKENSLLTPGLGWRLHHTDLRFPAGVKALGEGIAFVGARFAGDVLESPVEGGVLLTGSMQDVKCERAILRPKFED